MKRIVARREATVRWTSFVGPRIQKILEKNSKLSRFEWDEYAGNEKFQVRHNAGIIVHSVDLRARTCTCRGWQLSGIPCCHVIALLVSRGLNVVDYVHAVYKKDCYLITYTPSISPITGPDSWPSPGLNLLRPPAYTKKVWRPKKNRRKQKNEVESSSQAKKSRMSSQNETPSETTLAGISGAKKRAGQTQSYRKCGESGYNSRSCKGAPPPTRN
ncbi:uncharacterized protein LOC111411397 [Olea europaea var. sylvestris]|uniref:uncharacterized protein LOC111411397 n=1 Tax=Olea europaea var. sylvestris TaxID=158386 RepID=UPI000C1D6392|nr:uncharacterized protein LOC111411397 [Olea europaea var. sylvestris]